MEYETQEKLALFTTNAQAIKKEFFWHNNMTKRLAALLYALENKQIDCEAIQRRHALIRQNTNAFSTFRGNMALCLATLLALSPDPQSLLDETLFVYNLLKGAKFRASDYLVIAAYQIAAQTSADNYLNVLNRTKAFYNDMKAQHFFHTGQDDYIFGAMLGLADIDVEEGSLRIERLYNRLKGEFWSKNSVQALAQVLVLGGSDDDATGRVLALRDALREQKIRLDKSYTLSALGVLALLPVEIDVIVNDIGAAQTALRGQKWFGPLYVAAQELLLYAVALVAGEYAQNIKDGVVTAMLSTSITNIIIAQQAAMAAAASASAASASSSS